MCSACFLRVWNVTCCPHPFSVLNCHVWNKCTSKVFFFFSRGFGGVWEQVLVACLKTLQELRTAANFSSSYRNRNWSSLHIELNVFLPVLLSLIMAKTLWLSFDVLASERRANSNFHLPAEECVFFFCSSRLRNVELEGWNEIGSVLVSHSSRTVLAVLTWKFIHSIAITLKCTLHLILLILLLSVTLHKNNQGKYY